MGCNWSNTPNWAAWAFKLILQIWKECREKKNEVRTAESATQCDFEEAQIFCLSKADVFQLSWLMTLVNRPSKWRHWQIPAYWHLMSFSQFLLWKPQESLLSCRHPRAVGCEPTHQSSTFLIAEHSPVGKARPKWNTEVWRERERFKLKARCKQMVAMITRRALLLDIFKIGFNIF